jgi:cellulose biosynthesis protein BcsQ
MRRQLAVPNQKGATGKSTIAGAAGSGTCASLVADVDPQADATTMLGVDPEVLFRAPTLISRVGLRGQQRSMPMSTVDA